MKFLEGIVKDMNPMNDFKHMTFYGHRPDETLGESWRTLLKNTPALLGAAKPFARGGIIGGIVGGVLSYVGGGDLKEGFIGGMTWGSIMDLGFYVGRAITNMTYANRSEEKFYETHPGTDRDYWRRDR